MDLEYEVKLGLGYLLEWEEHGLLAYSRTLLGDDTVMMIGGVAPVWKGYYRAFFFPRNKVRETPIAMTRWARKWITSCLTELPLRRLEITVDAGNQRDVEWATEGILFEPEGKLRAYGMVGEDHIIMSRIPR